MKIIYVVANASVIFAFFTQMCISQQGPSDEELEPESDDDGIDTSEEEDDDEMYDDDATDFWMPSLLYNHFIPIITGKFKNCL